MSRREPASLSLCPSPLTLSPDLKPSLLALLFSLCGPVFGCGAVAAVKNPPSPCAIKEVAAGKFVTRGESFELSGSGQLQGQTHRFRFVIPARAAQAELPEQYIISSEIVAGSRVTSMPTLCEHGGSGTACDMTLTLLGQRADGGSVSLAVPAISGRIKVTEVEMEGGQRVLRGKLVEVDFDLSEVQKHQSKAFEGYKSCRKARLEDTTF